MILWLWTQNGWNSAPCQRHLSPISTSRRIWGKASTLQTAPWATSCSPAASGWRPLIREAARTPRLGLAAAKAIAEADAIVYGPGTQHSSLLPSNMTEGVGEAIAANRDAEKLLIGNLDVREDDIHDLARNCMRAMTRKGAVALDWSGCVTRFLVQRSETGFAERAPFDPLKFNFPLETVRIRNWESHDGHCGESVLGELLQVLQSPKREERS
jgi:hypothetical protein